MTQFIGRKLMAMPAAVLVFAIPKMALACAMCGLPIGDHATHAYNTSVLFMLSGPYFTVAAIGGILFVAYRRAQRKQRESSAPTLGRR